ncbi:MAG: DNA adenine methylase [Nitrososphaerales archaeon]|nr:DNA adenine methylase [Nitrososphaerales archaeon]
MEILKEDTGVSATPFLKWAGGKSQLIQSFETRFPKAFGTYYEPFLGGGAVFFHLVRTNRITRARLSDSNADLVDCYLTIKDDLGGLSSILRDFQRRVKSHEEFYSARKRFNEIRRHASIKNRTERSALLIYLNRTCYNGLYRVNAKGEFNVPFGKYKNPRVYDEKNLVAVNRVLNMPSISVLHRDYHSMADEPKRGDFVYFDPPYFPISKTANFTSYTAVDFTWDDQRALSRLFNILAGRGCNVMLSNSPRVRELYEGYDYRIEVVKAGRAISSIGTKRGPVDELLVRNY